MFGEIKKSRQKYEFSLQSERRGNDFWDFQGFGKITEKPK